MSKIKFISEFIRQPGKIGAITPSSHALAQQMVKSAQVASADVIIECGPGTGVFSREILSAMPDNAKFGAVEVNAQFARAFRQHFPQVPLLEDSAEHIAVLLRNMDETEADSLVSGLPWAAFPELLQDTLLDAMLEVLKPGGHLATFAYLQGLTLPAGRRFHAKLLERFSSVKKSPTVWKNLPPALVYCCVR